MSDLNDSNFFLFAARNYQNYSATFDEFKEDLYRLRYIKKIISRYKNTGEIKERLILNHLVILRNCFGNEATVRMIWLKMEDHLPQVKCFLIALGMLPKKVYKVKGKNYDTDDIELDSEIVKVLRGIKNG